MISLIMVSYHTGDVLWRSLDAALAADEVGEVILVDNGNPADVTTKLEAMAAQTPTLRLLTGHGNIGFAKGCNLGAEEATGQHFLFLNPDAILPPDGATALRDAGEQVSEEHWVTGPTLQDPDGSEQRGSRRKILTPWNAFVEASRLYVIAPNHPAFARFNAHESEPLTEPTRVPCLSGACFLTPRATWEMLGGMDERYFLHVEDVDFFLRLTKSGGPALAVPSVRVTHFKSSSQVDPLFVERRKKQSMNLYFATHFTGVYPPGFLTLLRAMLWLSFSFRSLTWRLRGRGR